MGRFRTITRPLALVLAVALAWAAPASAMMGAAGPCCCQGTPAVQDEAPGLAHLAHARPAADAQPRCCPADHGPADPPGQPGQPDDDSPSDEPCGCDSPCCVAGKALPQAVGQPNAQGLIEPHAQGRIGPEAQGQARAAPFLLQRPPRA